MTVMSKEGLLALCERGVEAAIKAGADEAEVYATSTEQKEVAFEKNDLNLVRVVGETTFGIRVFRGGGVGFATSNRPEDLAAVAAEAVTVARLSPADPLNGLPQTAPVPEVEDAVDPALLEISLEELTRMGATLLRQTLGLDARLNVDSGALSVDEGVQAVASSAGARASFRSASAGGYLFGMAVDGAEVGSFSFGGDVVRRAAELLPALERAYGRFVEKCVGALKPRQGESFRGPILLPADVVEEMLMGDLLDMLGADELRKGRSPFRGREGERVASPLLTLIEAGAGLPGFPVAPFDREGVPRRPTPLIEAGELKGFLYDGYEARAAGRASGGHAVGGPGTPPSVGVASVTMSPGTTPLSEMIRVPRGVWVTRFSGSTNPVSGDFSGVVKGGFLLRDGERTPISETTLSGNLYECLKNISAVSDEREILQGVRAWPAIRIEDVSVTAG